MASTVHVIGAGLAGLSAATRLAEAGQAVALHEATAHAGGRCRSYHDPALGRVIDNGNHLILSGNRSALAYLERIGARQRVSGPPAAEFFFVDFASKARWRLSIGDSMMPWWIFSASRRVPDTRALDYLALARLLWRPGRKTVGEAIACTGALYEGLLAPMLLASLNNDPPLSSAALAAAVIRETVAPGGRNCRPLVAHDGLAAAFVDPALAFLARRGAPVHFGHQLRVLRFVEDRVAALGFGGDTVRLQPDDQVVLAAPPEVAGRLVPDLATPNEFRSIANIHFLVEEEVRLPPITGVLHAATQWIFCFPGRVAVTISNADSMLDMPREELAARIWTEVSAIAGLPAQMPPWQVVRERRATFATLPAQEERRPGARTRWRNLFLAGDWTETGLPPTIESAVRSGERAAEAAQGAAGETQYG